MSRSCFARPLVWILSLLVAAPALAQQTNPGRYLPPGAAPAQQPAPGGRYQTQPVRPGANRVARTPQAAQASRRPQPQPPVNLTPQQQAVVDQILALWESQSDKIRNYKCSFERWEYDPVFGPGKDARGQDVAKTKSTGQVKYSKPDRGMFKIDEIRHFTPAKQPGVAPTWEVRKGDHPEHWVCDGEAVYEYNLAKKQLIVRHLPPEMRGKAIADGPLPFLFGAEKEKLKRRYYIQMTQSTNTEIWLEAFPKYRQDAANYKKVELILDREKFLPKALRVHLPNGKNHTVYIFGEATVNSITEDILPDVFKRPHTPFGWKKVVEEPPRDPAKQATRPEVTPRKSFLR